MRFTQVILAATVLTFASSTAFAAPPRVHRGPTSPRLFKSRVAPAKPHAQASMAPERATEIQTALVKAGYLSGTPTGVWDKESQDAVRKMQADNGWQTKLVPDSRAIIKLGLGPNAGTPAGELVVAGAENVDAPVSSEGAAATMPANK